MASLRPRREGFLHVRAGADEAARWTAAAEAAGHPSLSSWIRALADQGAATRGIGNNLNQLARAMNEGHGVDGQAVRGAVRDVEAARRAVSRALAVIRPPRSRTVPLP